MSSKAIDRLGLQVTAVSATGEKAGDGHPLILWRGEPSGGGLAVLDIPGLAARPDHMAYGNLTATILANLFGRPQAGFGRYVHPGFPLFDFDRFSDELRAVAGAQPSLRLREEGLSREGRPILSLELGPVDAPTFFVDCGIHSDEWAPCFGSILYLQRLAREYDQGLPWARAMLRNLRLKVIPLLSPDGWVNHVRFIRSLDLNRNFPVCWKEFKGPYKGPAALSEPETQAVAALFKRDRVVAVANWHETSANTNWVGYASADGRYRKYAASVPGIFKQVIDGRHFGYQAATWTQITDPRNFHFHAMDSHPYVRDYSPQRCPYELFYADSLGIDGLTIEQYGNSDHSCGASPQRTEITGQIIEMLFGLQIGLVCRNHGNEPLALDIPLITAGARGEVSVCARDGERRRRTTRAAKAGMVRVAATLQPQEVLVVELDPPPWRRDRAIPGDDLCARLTR